MSFFKIKSNVEYVMIFYLKITINVFNADPNHFQDKLSDRLGMAGDSVLPSQKKSLIFYIKIIQV
jgi:hypothetical protein